MLQRCRLCKRSQNLPAGHCVAGVQAVKMESEPTCRALCCKGAVCLSGVKTYLPDAVLQVCRLFKGSQNLPAGRCAAGVQAVRGVRTYLVGTVLQGCRLFKGSQNLPAGHCWAGVQAV